jgi:hypothetical protein
MSHKTQVLAVPKALLAVPLQATDSARTVEAVLAVPERYVFGGTR